MELWHEALAIISATFVSEDLTCISTGLLIRAGRLDSFVGISACMVGIFVGDLLLFAAGKAMRGGVNFWPSLQRRIKDQTGTWARINERFQREGWKLLFLARFVPGLRLPVYVGAGFLGGRWRMLALIALLAGLIWTPTLVLLAAYIGTPLKNFIERFGGSGWWTWLATILLLYWGLHLLFMLTSHTGRRRLAIQLRKFNQPEFWPPLLFYAPLIPGWLYWSLRYGGFHTITVANPGIADSGVIGESKSDILARLPQEWVLDWAYIPATADLAPPQKETLRTPYSKRKPCNSIKSAQGLTAAQNGKLRWNYFKKHGLYSQKKWSFPFILKPDQGQRGVGVKLIRNAQEAQSYLGQTTQAMLIQSYHAGPYESGIFYCRLPHLPKGYIFSITDKHFPIIYGDGQSTLAELIWRHPRYRMQAEIFLQRHNAKQHKTLRRGAPLALTITGNHAQGAMFRDGSHLYSPALERRIDRICQAFRGGYYFGRFDVRYSDPRQLKQGRSFKIIELNGATSESTNIYDPRFSVYQMYRTLYRQWQLLFMIGHQNQKRGLKRTPQRKLLQAVWQYRQQQKAPFIAD